MELIKENIEYEQLLGEDIVDTIVKEEYVIPDTHPDVEEILMVDTRPYVLSKEIIQGKVHIEGEIEYNILYLSRLEEETQAFNVTYKGKFTNVMNVQGAEQDMICDAQCYVEHMDCFISNERKVSVEGIIKVNTQVYKKYAFDVVKNIEKEPKIQLLKNPISVDKIVASENFEMEANSRIQIDMNEGEIENIIRYDCNIVRSQVTLYENKAKVNADAIVEVLYKGNNERDIKYLKDEIKIERDIDIQNIDSFMQEYTELRVDAIEVQVKEDDLGEKRIIEGNMAINGNIKVINKEEINMVEDAYSPNSLIRLEKENYVLNVIHGKGVVETLTKEDISIDENMLNPQKIIMCSGNASITDTKLVEDKVIIDGVVEANILYKTKDKDKYINVINTEIPFNCQVEIPGTKINMNSECKVKLENIEAFIEPGNISVKAIVKVYARVNYSTTKDFITDIKISEEIPEKKSSIIIYSVQSGDTLWKIAKRYYCNIDDLIRINDIEDPNLLKIGEKLIIPGKAIV